MADKMYVQFACDMNGDDIRFAEDVACCEHMPINSRTIAFTVRDDTHFREIKAEFERRNYTRNPVNFPGSVGGMG